jgi:hypothetical protein
MWHTKNMMDIIGNQHHCQHHLEVYQLFRCCPLGLTMCFSLEQFALCLLIFEDSRQQIIKDDMWPY